MENQKGGISGYLTMIIARTREGENGRAYKSAIRKHIARSELDEGTGLKLGIIVARGLTALQANLRVT